jgi:circadian clock protein KaiB
MKKPPHYKFRLYVAGNSPNSTKAITNLRALCEEILREQHEIEVIDVLKEPQRALKDGVHLTPMLLKLSPSPTSTIIGSLNDRQPLLQALGLPPIDG